MQTRVREIMTLFKTAVESAPSSERQLLDGVDLVFNAFDRDGFTKGDGAGWALTKPVDDLPGQYLLRELLERRNQAARN